MYAYQSMVREEWMITLCCLVVEISQLHVPYSRISVCKVSSGKVESGSRHSQVVDTDIADRDSEALFHAFGVDCSLRDNCMA